MLPDDDTILRSGVHLILGADIEGLVEGVNVSQCLIDTQQTEAVGVELCQTADLSLRDVLTSKTCISDVETLVRSEAIELSDLLAFVGHL